MASEFINHSYVMELSYKNPKGGVLESLHAGEPKCFHGPPCQAPSSVRTEALLFKNLLCVSLHLAVDSRVLISFAVYQ